MTLEMNNGIVAWIVSGLFVLFTLVSGWAYNSIDTRIRATEVRVDAIMQGIADIRSDVSYIRGRLESQLDKDN